MRTWETVLVAILAVTIAGLLTRRRIGWLAGLGIVAAMLQLALEAFRWQMAPAYVLAAFLLVVAIVSGRAPTRPRFSVIRFLGACLLLPPLLAAIALPILLPVFRIPDPTGPYAVGTSYLHLVDETRDELFTPEVGDSRSLLVQVWYPALPVAGSVAEPYTRHAAVWSRVWTEDSSLRALPFFWNHLGLVKTHSHLLAPPDVRAGDCPVLLFSHGNWQCWKRHTSLLEDLASHGYVVFALSHPFLTPFTIGPGGEAVTFSRSHPRLRDLAAEMRRADPGLLESAMLDSVAQDQSTREFEQFYKQFKVQQQVTETWARDISFVLDELKQSSDDIFMQLLDLDRIGVLGFSRGGQAAGLAALSDPRIKAGVNLDGWQTGHLLSRDLTCPFLFFTGDALSGANEYFFQRAAGPVYELTLRGARHANFHDMALAAPIPGRLTGRLGDLKPEHGLQLVRAHILAFLDQHLRGRPATLLTDHANPNPDIQLRMR